MPKNRWTITYKTKTEIVGTISVGEILSQWVPASQFIYGEVSIDALSPDYVKLGRDRPNEGPLLIALNAFVHDKIIELAKEINKKREQHFDDNYLDEVHEENKLLDRWKNKILSEIVEGITGPSEGGLGEGNALEGRKIRSPPTPLEWGDEPTKIDVAKEKLILGRGIKFHLATILKPSARDYNDNPVSGVNFGWWSDNHTIVRFSVFSDEIECLQKGSCNIGVKIQGTNIYAKIPIEVWEVEHILLTPRKLEIPLGNRKKMIAEVTNDVEEKNTNVLLNWKHDAIDQLIVRISPKGIITGNRVGKTVVYAGAGDVLSKIGSEIEVVQNPNLKQKGRGFPKLLMTERDVDPDTGTVRNGDVDKPALWQEFSDVRHNIWWINMHNPQSSFAFKAGDAFWRMFHAEKLIDMVVQALMQNEFTQKGDEEEPKHWGDHKFIMDGFANDVVQAMWNKLVSYVEKGKEELI